MMETIEAIIGYNGQMTIRKDIFQLMGWHLASYKYLKSSVYGEKSIVLEALKTLDVNCAIYSSFSAPRSNSVNIPKILRKCANFPPSRAKVTLQLDLENDRIIIKDPRSTKNVPHKDGTFSKLTYLSSIKE